MSIIDNSPVGGNINARERRSIDLDGPPIFIVHFDDDEAQFHPADLTHNDWHVDLLRRCSEATSCSFNLELLPTIQDADRQLLIHFMVEIQRSTSSVSITIGGEQSHDNLFAALLGLLELSHDVTRIQRCTDGAIEAAALINPSNNGIRIACSVIIERLRTLGVRDVRASQLANQAFEFRGQSEVASTSEETQNILSEWPDAPCDADLTVPGGWGVGDRQIVSSNGQEILPCRIIITRLFQDIEGGVCSVELAWARGDHWMHRTCTREQISSNRAVVELSNYDLPVNTNNAPVFVDYLADFERDNLEMIPRSRIARRLGWFGRDGQDGFLCGRDFIVPSQGETHCREHGELEFRGDDEGDEQIVDAIRAEGAMQEWINAVAPLQAFPRVLLGLYASLSPPILRIVRGPNFIVSYDGRTSSGKTTTQIVAASCWGYPILNGPEGCSILHGWDATRVFIERTAAIRTCLPAILDDTKVARNKNDVISTIYQFVNGAGRGRGSQRGVATTRSWQSVMISSGEESLTDFTQDGGSRARVLSLWGSPFSISREAGRLTVSLREQLEDHYGHAGPALVRYLVNNRSLWPDWRDWYRQCRQSYQELAGNNSVASRMAACFATLELTAHLAHQAIPFPWDYHDTVRGLWTEITADTDEADRGLAALRYIITWCHSRREDFKGGEVRDHAPSGGWLGVWNIYGRDESSAHCLAIYPHKLDEALDERGYSPGAIRRLWKDSEWLRTEENKTTKRVRTPGARGAMVAIRWSAIEQLMEGSESFVTSNADTGDVVDTTGTTEGPRASD